MQFRTRNLSGIILLFAFIMGLVQMGYTTDARTTDVRINNKINARIHKFTKTIKSQEKEGIEVIPAEISVNYPEFTTLAESKTVVSAINKAVKDRLLKVEITENNHFTTIDEIYASFSEDFKSSMKINLDSIGAWFLKLEVLIRFSDEDLLSLDIMDSLFNGSAHTISSITYHVFSLKTGNPVLLSDIIQDNKADELIKIAEEQFRKLKKITKNTSYQDAGFTFADNKFTLNNNFLIFKKGLLFYYNPYEIAPYGMGETRLLIPWSKLKNIIKPQSIADKFLK